MFADHSFQEVESGGASLEDPVLWIAECSQLLTVVAALQCVERGLIDLDEDVSGIYPQFKDLKIPAGFEGATQEPVFTRSTVPITLRCVYSQTTFLIDCLFELHLLFGDRNIPDH